MTRKHVSLMLLGCLVPLAAPAATFILHVPVNSVVFFGLLLLCLALHVLMMKRMAPDQADHEVLRGVSAEPGRHGGL